METIVRFEMINGRGILLFQCYEFEDDKSFKTGTILLEQREDHFRFEQIGYTKTFKVYPKASYETFIQTKDFKEANLLRIEYYMGSDSKDIIEAIDEKTFIIDDKIPVEYRVPTKKWPGGSAQTAKGRVNDILKYIGLDHVEKPLELVRYEGDCYSKIELLPECRYKLYKKFVD
jgi:hypothetical protein